MGMSRLFLAIFLLCGLYLKPLLAEGFGNSSLFIPKFGVAFFDSPLEINKKPWGIGYQWCIGSAFMHAIDYRFWWIAESNFAIGTLTSPDAGYVSAFMGGAGVRMNFMEHDFRPYGSLVIHYLQLLGANAKRIPLKIDWPIFVGLKPSLGLDWLFYSEMSLSLDFAYAFYLHLSEPFRHVFFLNTAFAVYF
jgi:hypothetical protein